ncbi:MAG: flagellar basal body-associated FliL family protein [Rhodoferax sp.]
MAKTEEAAGEAKPKSKKMLIIILAVVLVLVLGAGGAFVFISKQKAAAAADEEGGGHGAAQAPAPVAHAAAPGTPPVYLPMDPMVVNLADPGGDRVAQVGITFQVIDAKAAEEVKKFMPTIRSGVLMLLSRRTAAELLSPEGKEKLIEDILREASVPWGGGEEPNPKKKKAPVQYPVTNVLFSSLIVQ